MELIQLYRRTRADGSAGLGRIVSRRKLGVVARLATVDLSTSEPAVHEKFVIVLLIGLLHGSDRSATT